MKTASVRVYARQATGSILLALLVACAGAPRQSSVPNNFDAKGEAMVAAAIGPRDDAK